MKIVINDVIVEMAPMKFDDIREGDVVAHFFVDSDRGDVKLWVGETSEYSEVEKAWFGPYRKFSEGNDYFHMPMTPFRVNTARPEMTVLVVAKWQEELDGHEIYRVLSEETNPIK